MLFATLLLGSKEASLAVLKLLFDARGDNGNDSPKATDHNRDENSIAEPFDKRKC